MIVDIPYTKAFLIGDYVGRPNEYIECYLFAVTLISNRPLLFTCHTSDGAVFSRLPLWTFTTANNGLKPKQEEVEPWCSLSSNGNVIKHTYLKDFGVKTKFNKYGRYLFTIDQEDGGFTEDPEQHKTFNVIQLDDGYFCALPNNYCLWLDGYFSKTSKTEKWPVYTRQETYWVCEE